MPLPTINFLVTADSDEHLASLSEANVDRDWHLFAGGVYCWGLQTYLILRERFPRVILSRDICPGAINVGHYRYLEALRPGPNAFVVSIRADYSRQRWAQACIVQNRNQLASPHSFWIPLWPQAGLVPRSSTRSQVRTVAYCGRTNNMAETEGVQKETRRAGLTFVARDEGSWNDYSDIDIVFAIRSFDRNPHDHKPATKLLNAWAAGVPFIGGWDSAYSQIAVPDEEYIRAENLDGLGQAFRRLSNDADYYRHLVERGNIRSQEFSRERIADAWYDTVNHHILPLFVTWSSRGRMQKRLRHEILRATDDMHRSALALRQVAGQWYRRIMRTT